MIGAHALRSGKAIQQYSMYLDAIAHPLYGALCDTHALGARPLTEAPKDMHATRLHSMSQLHFLLVQLLRLFDNRYKYRHCALRCIVCIAVVEGTLVCEHVNSEIVDPQGAA